MEIKFTGKTAVVTGGGRGIGRQIALQLAECGANVWIGDIDNENSAETVKNINKSGVIGGYTFTDVTKIDQVNRLMDDALKATHGKIDILVHGAAIIVTGPLLTTSQKAIEDIINVNVLGMCNVIKNGLERMIPNRSGKIVLISSIAGRRGFKVQGHYNATKAAGINFAQSAAVEAGPFGINVNTVCPGIIRTQMWDQILEEGEKRSGISQSEEWDNYMKMIPQGRAQTPEEIANVTLFLCSDLASAINGQAINVDGGMTLN